MSGSNVTAVSAPTTVHRVATASRRDSDRSYLALLLALSALVMWLRARHLFSNRVDASRVVVARRSSLQ
jgi:hypothetical protein